MNMPYKEYRYYDNKTKVKAFFYRTSEFFFLFIKSINFNGLIADLDDAEKNSIILLHACAHNPTGKLLRKPNFI